jgi:hypothetical protein
METTTKTIAQQFSEAGFSVSPNNIHSLPGREWSAMSGVSTVGFGFEIREIEGAIYILKLVVTPRAGTTFVDYSHSFVAQFKTVAEFKNSELLTRKAESLPSGIWGD